MRVNNIFWESRANGPGLRTAIFFQGCTLGCKNCINPETHNHLGGYLITEKEIIAGLKIRKDFLEGITCSGGEPFQQPEVLLKIAAGAKELALSVIVSTGYELNELYTNIKHFPQIIKYLDVIICGRYSEIDRMYIGYRGSANKSYYFFSSRYAEEILDQTHRMEIQVQGNKIISSGIDLNNFFPWSGFTHE